MSPAETHTFLPVRKSDASAPTPSTQDEWAETTRSISTRCGTHLAPNMTQPGDAVEAVALAAAVAEHAHDLRVLLARLLEFELAFGLLVLVLAAPPVLAALALILRHDLRVAASSASCEGTRVCKGSSCVHRRGGVAPLGAMRATEHPSSIPLYTRSERAVGPPPSALPGSRRATALCAFGGSTGRPRSASTSPAPGEAPI